MKLNKKGFGVAEIAIVILLIGILAAAVIVGFMGIKKNATEHVKEEATKSLEIIHQTKHAYPTILSKDLTTGLKVGDGEYEVYELGGYSIKGTGHGGVDALTNKGTLFITGNGTIDTTSVIDGGSGWSVQNYGDLTLSDLIVKGGKGKKIYPFTCYGGSVTTLNNIICEGDRSVFNINKNAKVFISGVNTHIYINPNTGGTGRYLFYLSGEVTIYDGTFNMKKDKNTYAWINGGKMTIENATFKQDTPTNYHGFLFTYTSGGQLIIKGGSFDCRSSTSFITFDGASGSVTISGGEFKNAPTKFATGVDASKKYEYISITGGTFYFDPKIGNANGWGEYVPKDTHKIVDNGNGTYTVKGINE